jgi:hypothetical protein
LVSTVAVTASGTLFVIATPLGNPADLAPRALEALRASEVIFAEDTRTARALLAAHGLDRPTHSCFDANEAARAGEATALLAAGKSVGLVSEAGMPAISDPGFRLVRAAIDAGARVVPVPGPAALLLALIGSACPPIASSSPGSRRASPARAAPSSPAWPRCPPRSSSTNPPIAWRPRWPTCGTPWAIAPPAWPAS